jgi:hypothetical protein
MIKINKNINWWIGNDLYFPDNIDCPINYISITETNNDTNCKTCSHKELNNNKYLHVSNKETDGKIIAKAVNLGMKYQEEKIKEGIKIVFNELNK